MSGCTFCEAKGRMSGKRAYEDSHNIGFPPRNELPAWQNEPRQTASAQAAQATQQDGAYRNWNPIHRD